ncbi:hypothetical protein GF326_13375 [Candidatus Bathyarchaeota archaeon]|nr:hypothetical protein [Candidatus Bathyarchaeota archaeon]
MVKKKELKKRAIYVYPPVDMSENWKTLAQESGTSISKFVIEHVENSLRQAEDDYRSRSNVLEENRQLRETLSEKEKRNHHLELLVDKLEEDLRTYRNKLFSDQAYQGKRTYDKQLVTLLRESGAHDTDVILNRLGIKPNQVESIKVVSKQLENLEAYGLIRKTGKGWIWE